MCRCACKTLLIFWSGAQLGVDTPPCGLNRAWWLYTQDKMKLLYKCSFCTPTSTYIYTYMYLYIYIIIYMYAAFIVFWKIHSNNWHFSADFQLPHRFGFTSWRLKPMHLGEAMGSTWLVPCWILGWKPGARCTTDLSGWLLTWAAREIHHELKMYLLFERWLGFPACYVSKTRRVGFVSFLPNLDGTAIFVS